jgi:hypothetical protein
LALARFFEICTSHFPHCFHQYTILQKHIFLYFKHPLYCFSAAILQLVRAAMPTSISSLPLLGAGHWLEKENNHGDACILKQFCIEKYRQTAQIYLWKMIIQNHHQHEPGVSGRLTG